jgi:hypothetical protein
LKGPEIRRVSTHANTFPGQDDPKTILAKWEKYRAAQKEKAAKGGKARAARLSKKKLSEQGRKAIQARWAKYRESKKEVVK